MKKLLILVVSLSLIVFTTSAIAFGGDADAEADANAAINMDSHDNIKNEATKARPNAGPVPIPGQPGWFTTPTPDGSFQSLKAFLDMGNDFTEGALENLAKGSRVRVYVRDANDAVKATFDDPLAKRIRVVLVKPEKAQYDGPANGEAINGKTNSIQVMAAIALKALRQGSNVLYLVAEGAHRKVEAFGWGIGFSQTRASQDNLSTGGTGISGGEAGPEDRPWLQGFAMVE